MLSAELALTRDTIKHARWASLALLSAFTFIFLLMENTSANILLLSNALRMHHILLMLFLIAIYFLITSALCDSSGNSFRIQSFNYKLPKSTPWIVACQMGAAMAISGATHFALAILARLCWNFDWPLITLTLTIMALTSLAIAAIFLFENMPLIQIWTHVAIVIAVWRWICSHYVPHGYYGYWKQNAGAFIWHTLSLADIITLLTTIAIAYAIALYAAKRNRSGQQLNTDLIKNFLIKQLDRLPSRKHPFTSPFRAQLWYEWRTNGAPATITVILAAAAAITIYIFNPPDAPPNQVLLVALNLCIFGPICFAPLIAFGYAHFGASINNPAVPPFRATQPLSDTRLLLNILYTALICWASLWITAALAFATIAATIAITSPQASFNLHLNNIPPTTLIAFFLLLIIQGWIALTLTATPILWGRPKILITFAISTSLLFIATLIAKGQHWISSQTIETLLTCIASAIPPILATLTTAAFYFAIKKRLINIPTLTIAILAAIAITTLATNIHYNNSFITEHFSLQASPPFSIALAFALAAILPIAAAPLALNANRHR